MFGRSMTIAVALMCGIAGALPAAAATLLETTQVVASTASADAQLPDTIAFDVVTAGTYVVTLRDLITPSALTSLRAIVTRDLHVVADVQVTYPTGTPPLPDPVPTTDTFTATPGQYRIHVIGAPGDDAVGSFGVNVAPQGGGTSLVDAADSIVGDASPGPGQSVLQTTFVIAAAGTYQLAVTDHVFPAALQSVNVLLLPASGAPIMFPAGTTFPASFSAAADNYEILILATADATELAGLYSVRVSGGPASTIVYRSTNAVGDLPPARDLAIATGGPYSLTVADSEFPAALSSLWVAVVQDEVMLATRTAAGSTDNITTAAGAAQLFSFARPTDPAGVGVLAVRFAQGSQIAFADVITVDASPDPASPAIYAFLSPQTLAAGNYRLTLDDLRFLAPFVALEGSVAQDDRVIDRLDSEGELNVVLLTGRAKVIVAGRPPVNGGNALFGLAFAAQPSGTLVFESTQGVGGLFRSQALQIATAGRYDLSLADLEFPASLRTAGLAITRGNDLVGQIFGSQTLPPQQLAAGTYVLNFVGQPGVGQQYGAYGIKVADSAPLPTVTLTASATSVTSGDRVTLQWTSANATSCTAENGWTGSKTLTGTEQTTALTTNATFDIACSGGGGTARASATVTVNPPSANRGGGGGGSVDPLLLIYMCLALAACRRRMLSR